MKELSADVIIYGGSLGGTLAAYSAAKTGRRTFLFAESDWIGGQLTVQAVPPDEHKFIEETGCTASYRAYRKKVREHYRSHPYIIDSLKNKDYFCPGGSTVSRLAHPPKLALKLLMEMLEPFLASGTLKVFYSSLLKRAEVCGEEIRALYIVCPEEEYRVTGKYYLDGSDEGELIYESGCEYTSGAESREETGEPSAARLANSSDRQPVTWTLAFADRRKGDFVIERPREYEYFRRLIQPYDKYPVLSMYGPDSATGKAKRFGMYDGEMDEAGKRLFGLFTYRRIVCAAHFKDEYEPYDVTLLNWPQNDYFMGNTFDSENDAENREAARQLTLSFFYWLQTEAPREGGKGYPFFCPDGEIVGTENGLTKSYYVRESRRIKADFTVRENEISPEGNPAFFDSVGVGSYPIDLHITTVTHSFFYKPSKPFTIPLGAFIPVRMKNLLPACKNIGTTHLTNGCFRLHPTEWNIGEAAGLLAAYSLDYGVSPREIRNDKNKLKNFQEFLISNGIQLYW